MTQRFGRLLALFPLAFLLACGDATDEALAAPGEPIPGLSPAEQVRFDTGRVLFDRDYTAEEGLGPLFNNRRCSSCHDIPTLGGNGVEFVIKATRFEPPDRCDLLEDEGGDLIQQFTTPLLEAMGVRREAIPDRADAVVSMLPSQLYAMGLIDAIPDEEILAHADPDDADGNGIRGRAVRGRDGRVHRFGRKLTFATAREFIEDAMHKEMGITTPNFPEETTINGKPVPPESDPAPDPEVDAATIDFITDYVQFLAAVPREEPASAAARDSISAGEALFGRIGCAACHRPRMRTRSTTSAVLDGRTIRLYSDLLLHDLGPDMATVCGAAALPSQWRTAPLMGLRHRPFFMHDGRASSFRQAIEQHGGEADRTRSLFRSLTSEQQALLLRFLGSL
jgi:CxxC motif-containing protein (DUF1111 family)